MGTEEKQSTNKAYDQQDQGWATVHPWINMSADEFDVPEEIRYSLDEIRVG